MPWTSNNRARHVWNRFPTMAPKMRCMEDQIKDNIGLSQGWSEQGWMGREEVRGESENGGGQRKSLRESSWGWRWGRQKELGREKKRVSGERNCKGQEGREGRMVEVEGRTTLWGWNLDPGQSQRGWASRRQELARWWLLFADLVLSDLPSLCCCLKLTLDTDRVT